MKARFCQALQPTDSLEQRALANIAPCFHPIHYDIQRCGHTYYLMKGGRGSTKSSFASIEVILGIMENPGTHGIALRKVAENLADSVYSQLLWAISALEVEDDWIVKQSPLQLIYRPTGQKIYFRGADEPRKLKSIKPSKGYIRWIWYEEFDQFSHEEEIRAINQSLMRGGDKFTVIMTYNPPKSVNSWVNAYAMQHKESQLIRHSTYKDVPPEWLGTQFIADAEELERTKPESYRHEYGGEATGTGGAIFSNVIQRPITDEEIANFDRQNRGLDFGFTIHPASYHVNYYSKTSDTLYIFFEIYKTGLKNSVLAELILEENTLNETVKADSAEPKSISEMKDCGLNVVGAHKGKDSVRYGIKWLQDRRAIVIDPVRCPNAAREFTGYEHERDKHGNFRADYPDENNHSIDDQRYACEDYIEEERRRRERGDGGAGKGAQGSNITGARSSIVGKRGSRQW